jgi:hypothetical protein
MTELNKQQILIQQLSKVTNNKELIDLAVTLIESKQNIINFTYGSAYVLWDTETNTTFNDDEASFKDLLSHVASSNKDKITIVNSCQYPDLTEGCVRYLYVSSINVYYKITITKTKYTYNLTIDGYKKRYQEFWFDYLTFSARAWNDEKELTIYGIKPSTARGAELFVTEMELLNKYPDALIMT